jgi:internalin A
MNRHIVVLGLLVNLFVIPRLCLSQQSDPSPVNDFLEIAHDPSASAAQKKTIAAVIRSVKAKNAEEAYKKVMAGDELVLYGGGSESIADITPLASFKNVKTLVLYNNRISDISPLSTLTHLETLRLELNLVSDISPLRNLKDLQSLQIDDNQISDIRPLAGLVHLRTLWISRNKVTDITPLAGLSALQDLYLSGNPVKDLTPLTHMSVSDVRLSDLGIEDVSALRGLSQKIEALINIDLSKNKIRDIASLAHLDRVTNLNLSDNRIADISAFTHSKFNYLDLHNNQIADISAIASLSPRSVDVRNNPIEDYKPLVDLLRAQPNVEIRADRGFDKALSESVPAQPDLAKSPLVGRWRTEPFDSGEFGRVSMVLRLEGNGLCHMTLCPPGAAAETTSPIPTQHGHYSITGTVLTLKLGGAEAEKQEIQISGNQLILQEQNHVFKFKKVIRESQ